MVTGTDGKHVTVRFDSGKVRSFEHAPAKQPGKLVPREHLMHTDAQGRKVGVSHTTLPDGRQMTTRLTPEGTGSSVHLSAKEPNTDEVFTVTGMNSSGHVMVRRESRFPGEKDPSMVSTYGVNDVRDMGGDFGAAGKALLPARNLLLAQEEQMAKDHLTSIYGDQAHIDPGVQSGRAAMMLSWHVPDALHQRLAKSGFQIHAVDGPITDVLTDLKGQHSPAHDVTSPAGITWDQVTGVMDPNSKQVVIGMDARPGTAQHEAAHALDVTAASAIGGGHASDVGGFREAFRMASRSKALYPYYRQRSADSGTAENAGRMEFFAESFSTWLRRREDSAAERQRRMSVALAGGKPGAPKINGMAALDSYYTWLYDRLTSG